MKINSFEDFFKLQDHGSRMQLRECWNEAQRVLRDSVEADLTFLRLSEANRVRQAQVPMFQECLTWTPSDWITAICGELGESANFIKKLKRGDQGVKISSVIKELADVIIYTDILIQYYHYDTGLVVASKFDEVSDRVGSTVKLLPERTSS